MTHLLVAPEIVLRHGALEAVLAPAAGGRITALHSTDRSSGERIDWLVPLADEVRASGFASSAWPKAGCYPLAPYSNRIRAARFVWHGREVRLHAHPGEAHALHGVSQQRPWQLTQQRADGATMEYRHAVGDHGWPWAFIATQRVDLDEAGVRLRLQVFNDSDETMPCGLGFHPFIPDSFAHRVRFDAGCVWPPADDFMPTRSASLTQPDDYSTPRALENRPFTQYYGGCSGAVDLVSVAGHAMRIEPDETLRHLVLYRPGTGGYVCIEPVSHVADAANLASAGRDATGWTSLPAGTGVACHVRLRLRLA